MGAGALRIAAVGGGAVASVCGDEDRLADGIAEALEVLGENTDGAWDIMGEGIEQGVRFAAIDHQQFGIGKMRDGVAIFRLFPGADLEEEARQPVGTALRVPYWLTGPQQGTDLRREIETVPEIERLQITHGAPFSPVVTNS
jgi:hypothetical protein